MKNEIIELLSDLIGIDSSNQFLVEGSPGSADAQAYIQDYLNGLNIETELQVVDEGHSNLKATIKGSGGGNPLTVYAHTDTVGYKLWPEKALKARCEGDKLIGLGASDDKGHCAAMMLLAGKIIREGLKLDSDLHLCFVDDEEGQTCGSFDYVKKNEPEACIILEPAPIDSINICHQGFGWLRIIVAGKAGHGSAGGSSIDAIARLAEIIVRLEKHKNEKFTAHPHELNDETVYHTGYIKGGTDFATYPASAELGIEIGTQPGETIDDRVREIEAIINDVKTIYPDLDARVEVVIGRDPFNTKGTEQLLEITKESIKKISGKTARCVGENAWGDAQIFQDAGFPTLGLGAEGGNLHAPDEWISISQLESLIEILYEIVKDYCGKAEDE